MSTAQGLGREINFEQSQVNPIEIKGERMAKEIQVTSQSLKNFSK
jgi:hypothetical protein